MFSEHLWLSLSTDSMIPSVLATTRFLPKISFHLLTNMQEMLPHLKRTNEVKWTQSQRVIKVQGSALVTTHHVAPHGVDLIPSATRVAAAKCSSDKNKYQICSLICSIWIHPKLFLANESQTDEPSKLSRFRPRAYLRGPRLASLSVIWSSAKIVKQRLHWLPL